MNPDDVFCLQHSDIRIMKGGVAKLPRRSLVAPLFYRMRDSKRRVSVEEMRGPLRADYFVTYNNVHEFVPGLYMDCTNFQLNNTLADDYFQWHAVGEDEYWPLCYFASVRFDKEVTNKLQGRTYVGFVLFVGDLRQL